MNDWWSKVSKRTEGKELERVRLQLSNALQENFQLKDDMGKLLEQVKTLMLRHQEILTLHERLTSENVHLRSILNSVGMKHGIQ